MSASLYFFASAKKIDELNIYRKQNKKNRNKIHSKKAIICATYSLSKSKELTVSHLHLKKGKAKNAKRMRSVQMPKVTFTAVSFAAEFAMTRMFYSTLEFGEPSEISHVLFFHT